MQSRDSLGVPLEPPEEKVVAYDWEGKELFKGDDVIKIDGQLVLDERKEILEFVSDYPKYTLGVE